MTHYHIDLMTSVCLLVLFAKKNRLLKRQKTKQLDFDLHFFTKAYKVQQTNKSSFHWVNWQFKAFVLDFWMYFIHVEEKSN